MEQINDKKQKGQKNAKTQPKITTWLRGVELRRWNPWERTGIGERVGMESVRANSRAPRAGTRGQKFGRNIFNSTSELCETIKCSREKDVTLTFAAWISTIQCISQLTTPPAVPDKTHGVYFLNFFCLLTCCTSKEQCVQPAVPQTTWPQKRW